MELVGHFPNDNRRGECDDWFLWNCVNHLYSHWPRWLCYLRCNADRHHPGTTNNYRVVHPDLGSVGYNVHCLLDINERHVNLLRDNWRVELIWGFSNRKRVSKRKYRILWNCNHNVYRDWSGRLRLNGCDACWNNSCPANHICLVRTRVWTIRHAVHRVLEFDQRNVRFL